VTYCLALRLDEGLVFLADTRTNAGVDNVSTYRKMHVFRPAPDRLFVLESAGSLAGTQQVLDRIEQDLASPSGIETLATVTQLFEAALYIGRISREVADQHRIALSAVGADGSSTFILGGQIQGGRPDTLLIYPEGNYIRASDERPFLQIGETKYGKFLLELAVAAPIDLETAGKIALSSMISTAHANLSVGPPYDLAIYRNDSYEIQEHRIPIGSEYLARLEEVWGIHLLGAIGELPHVQDRDLDP